MTEKNIQKHLKEKFATLRKELGLKITFNDLDDAFMLTDAVKKEGFVSDHLARQLGYIIVDYYMSWNNYLHSLIMPNPQNMLNMSESKVFGPEEKTRITTLMKTIMELASRHSLLGFTKDQAKEKIFFVDAYAFWTETFKKELETMLTKVNKEWGEQS